MNNVLRTITDEEIAREPTRIIKAVSTKPLGLRIREDFFGKNDPICVYELKTGVIRNVRAALDSKGTIIFGPPPFASSWEECFGHEFHHPDVERVYLDDQLVWIPREMREDTRRHVDICEQGIISLDLLDYPEIAQFIAKNREAFDRLGLQFDK